MLSDAVRNVTCCLLCHSVSPLHPESLQNYAWLWANSHKRACVGVAPKLVLGMTLVAARISASLSVTELRLSVFSKAVSLRPIFSEAAPHQTLHRNAWELMRFSSHRVRRNPFRPCFPKRDAQ